MMQLVAIVLDGELGLVANSLYFLIGSLAGWNAHKYVMARRRARKT